MHKFHPKVFSCFSTLSGKQQQKLVFNLKKTLYLMVIKVNVWSKTWMMEVVTTMLKEGWKRMTKPKVGLKVGRWLRTLSGCRIPSDWQGLLLLQLCTLGVHCSEVGWSSVSPLASRVLTHRRSWDFSSIPLDRDLSHGQQVVFQSLELQEVPISPQRLSSRSCQ